jgi:hypothetical protein
MIIHAAKCFLFAGIFLLLAACSRSRESAEHRSANPDSVAGKAGQAAYTVSKETGKAAVVVGRETGKAAKVVGHKVAEAANNAHEGWKSASEENKAKRDQ